MAMPPRPEDLARAAKAMPVGPALATERKSTASTAVPDSDVNESACEAGDISEAGCWSDSDSESDVDVGELLASGTEDSQHTGRDKVEKLLFDLQKYRRNQARLRKDRDIWKRRHLESEAKRRQDRKRLKAELAEAKVAEREAQESAARDKEEKYRIVSKLKQLLGYSDHLMRDVAAVVPEEQREPIQKFVQLFRHAAQSSSMTDTVEGEEAQTDLQILSQALSEAHAAMQEAKLRQERGDAGSGGSSSAEEHERTVQRLKDAVDYEEAGPAGKTWIILKELVTW
eukprot:TRINITY_DN6063_c0_g2_i2.p1 TRINITY_DN6063_c0_g2~~TRINITY_DN6063_c0_g2_i2.p1  ORF type:complete len:285 (+),score=88.44 TRINITY_DN6063_c0_g2_i2:93-947(+)